MYLGSCQELSDRLVRLLQNYLLCLCTSNLQHTSITCPMHANREPIMIIFIGELTEELHLARRTTHLHVLY